MGTKWYSSDFKLAAVEKARTAPSIPALSRQLGVHNSQIYRWLRLYAGEGANGLCKRSGPAGRVSDPEAKIAELERKVGQQAMDLDFLRRAFRRVKESRPNSDSSGATASTK
jgi:transposase-like protein